MYDMKINVTRYIEQNESLPIDLYISEEDKDRVYELWGKGVTQFGWDIPISMRGGIFSITIEMLKSIPEEELEKIFYKKRTERLLEAMSRLS